MKHPTVGNNSEVRKVFLLPINFEFNTLNETRKTSMYHADNFTKYVHNEKCTDDEI